MKNKIFRLIGAGALMAGMMFAQTAPTGTATPNEGGRGTRMLNRVTQALNLTSDQQSQFQQIMANFRQTAQPIRQQLRTDRKALMSAARTNPNADLSAQASAVSRDMTQLTVARAQAFGQFYGILSPAQKQQVDNFHPHLHRGGFGRG